MTNDFNHLYKFDEFTVDVFSRRLMRHQEPVALTSRAFDLLLVLMRNSGRLMSKDELMDAVWQDAAVEETNLAVNISALRKALGDLPNHYRFIVTIPGRGYKFLPKVSQNEGESEEILLHEHFRASVIEEQFVETGTPVIESRVQVSGDEVLSSKPQRNSTALVVAGLLVVGAMLGVVAVWGNRKPLLNRQPVKVTPFTSMQGDEREPAFSPDSRQLAFVRGGEDPDLGNNGVYIKLLHSETPLKITSKPGDYASPVWSPDGRFIAFTRHYKDDIGLYIVPALGGVERKLISANWESESSAQIDWSPDGELIAFTERLKDDLQEPYCLFLLSVETLEKIQLTFPKAPGVHDRFPVFSPDGKTLAFARISAEGTELLRVPAAGGESRRLVVEKKTINGLAWTAEGDLIFSSSRDGRRGLWRISGDGGEPKKQTNGEEASFPAISRQGNLLAYEQSSEDSNIWRLELDDEGRDPRGERIITSTRREAGIDISPDSKLIAYESDCSGSSELWVCNSDGSDNLQLTDFEAARIRSPRWSPDGRQIAFQCYAAGQTDIYVIAANGGPPRRLTDDAANDSLPTWSRDGRIIYFSSERDGRNQLWKIASEGGTAVKLTDSEAGNAIESPDGRTLYHSARFNPGLWQIPVEGGVGKRLLEFPERAFWGYWALVEKGIYYIRSDGKDHYRIDFFDFSTGKSRLVAPLEKLPTPWERGLAVSADGKWLLYSQLDYSNCDLMLVENFQ